jgi:hypothetical protein
MANFDALIYWIGAFGHNLVDLFKKLMGVFDRAGNGWEEAKKQWHSVDSKPIDEVEE